MITRLWNWWLRVTGARSRVTDDHVVVEQNHFWCDEMQRVLEVMQATKASGDKEGFYRAARAFNVVQRRWNVEVARKVGLEELEMLPIRRGAD